MTKAEAFIAMFACAYVAFAMLAKIPESQGNVLWQLALGITVLVDWMFAVRFLAKLLILIGDGMQQK